MEPNFTKRPAVRSQKAYGSLPSRQLVPAPAATRTNAGTWPLGRDIPSNSPFLEELTNPQSPLYRQVSGLVRRVLDGPVKSRRLAAVGCSELGAAMGLILAQQGRRVCLLDLSEGTSQLSWLLGLKETDPGLAELFYGEAELKALILRAKTLTPVRNCYLLSKGRLDVDWLKVSARLHALMGALERKFHHVILCLPDPADKPQGIRLMHELAIPRAMLKTRMTPEQIQRLNQVLPGCRIHRVI